MIRTKTALIIEDDPLERRSYVGFCAKLGFVAKEASSLAEAERILATENFDAVLVDLYLDAASEEAGGIQLLKLLRQNHENTIALAMSSDPNQDIAACAKESGALEFLKKPLLNADEIAIALASAAEKHAWQTRETDDALAVVLGSAVRKAYPHGIVIDPATENFAQIIARDGKIPSVILGETGTGKEEVVKLIHKFRVAKQSAIPLVSVNCSHLNGDIADSLLFGHRKGAFSGAVQNAIGYVGQANGGILFLDEIHCLSLVSQQKLLRVLNDGTYIRVGDTMERRSDFQIIAASTLNLDQLIEEGRFLLDLRTRLTGVDIHLKPLRERRSDIAPLTSLFFAKKGISIGHEELQKIVKRCESFYWQGNIRQLYGVLNALTVMSIAQDHAIRAENMPVFQTMISPEKGSLASSECPAAENLVVVKSLERALAEDYPLVKLVEEVEKAVIEAALKRHDKVKDVYLGLEIGRNTLDQKRKKYQIEEN
ncbi:MAG: sigma-54-dependent transcriptional regulator [Oligoflexales bacterium]